MIKFSKEQNLILKDLSPEQRRTKVREWYQGGQISKEQYNAFSIKSIRKEINKSYPVPPKTKRPHRKNNYEIAMTRFRHKLCSRLNEYLEKRDPLLPLLNHIEYKEFKKLINIYPACQDEINKLLEIGLRYPEPELNELCVDFINDMLKFHGIKNIPLWNMLWSTNHFVPNDTIRLMYSADGSIDTYFDKPTIHDLLPLMKVHLEKERLRYNEAQERPAQSINDALAKKQDIKRKNSRINAFEDLITKSEAYI